MNLFFHLSTSLRCKSLIITGIWVYEEMVTVYWWVEIDIIFSGGQFHNLNQEALKEHGFWPSESPTKDFYHKEIICAFLLYATVKLTVCVSLLLQTHVNDR